MSFVKDVIIGVFCLLVLVGGFLLYTPVIGGAVYGMYEISHHGNTLLPAIGWGVLFAVVQGIVGWVVMNFFASVVVIWK